MGACAPRWNQSAGATTQHAVHALPIMQTCPTDRNVELETLYDAACASCDAGDFSAALPLALQLVLQAPDRAEFTFLGGTCLQRLRVHGPAATLFGMAALGPRASPVAAYRLGECLVALEQPDEARQAFSACLALGRSADAAHDLMRCCQEALDQLQQGCKRP
jgi:predicted Zn-dependent protease